MIEILNKAHISCACLGNHDFGRIFTILLRSLTKRIYLIILLKDFGLDVLISSVEKSNFPWRISNIFDEDTKIPLGNNDDKTIININGFKVFIILCYIYCWN